MKLAPGHLPPIPTTPTMDRLPLPLPFSPDIFWRYPLGFPHLSAAAAATLAGQQSQQQQLPPASPLLDYKSQLPSSLASDPRVWSREDIVTFLRWAEQEFDLQPFEMDVFQMNGKAMCLLTRTDLSERAPGSGDVLHNVLQLLVRDANYHQRCLPSSPVTPTSRHHLASHHPYPLSPHSQPPTPTWAILPSSAHSSSGGSEGGGGGGGGFHGGGGGGGGGGSSHAAQLAAHLMAVQSQSVTLSPAPSVDSGSQTGSPQHPETTSSTSSSTTSNPPTSTTNNNHHHNHPAQHLFGISSMLYSSAGNSSGSNHSSQHSDSEEEVYHHGPSTMDGHHHQQQHMHLQQIQRRGGGKGGAGGLSSPPTTPGYITGGGGGVVAFPVRRQQQQQQQQQSESEHSPKEVLSPMFKASVKNEFFPSGGDGSEPNTNGRLLWDFLQQLLNDPSQRYTNFIAWKNGDSGVFKIVDPAGLAKLWGIQKNHLSMNYDKMSRALRYYYRVNILRKVQGERHCYQFLRNPTELKNIKNISLLRQQMSPTRLHNTVATTTTNNNNNTNTQPSNGNGNANGNGSSTNNGLPSNLINLPNITIKPEPLDMKYESSRASPNASSTARSDSASADYDEKPTDLSMDGPCDLSAASNGRHVTTIVCSPDQESIAY